MSDAYEDDLAAEEAIFNRIAAAEPQPDAVDKVLSKAGRPPKVNPLKLVAWRQAHKATIADTAARWKVSPATVKRLTRDYGEAAKHERKRWECERLDAELEAGERATLSMYYYYRSKACSWVSFTWFRRRQEAEGTPDEAAAQAAFQAALDAELEQFDAGWRRQVGPIPGAQK